MSTESARLDDEAHARVFAEKVLPRSSLNRGRRNIIFDTTLGSADHWIGVAKGLQALPHHAYEVEVRVVAAHRLESELSVHRRFARSLENEGYGRSVPKEVGSSVYKNLPANLDKVHAEMPKARIRIHSREGEQLYDSRVTPNVKPSAALEQAREARLTDPAVPASFATAGERKTPGSNDCTNRWRAIARCPSRWR